MRLDIPLPGDKYEQGPRTRGGLGGRTPPRIRDLYSKFFLKNFSYLFGPRPLDKNRSVAPEYEFARNQSCRMLELY